MHCLLEPFPLFTFLDSCCGEEQTSDTAPCDGDQCCPVESGKCIANWGDRIDSRGVGLFPVFLPAKVLPALPPDLFFAVLARQAPDDRPPWHFEVRAAGQPRSPGSFLLA